MDDKRRCYTCGSTKHMASRCPTTNATEEASPPKVMKAEKEETLKSEPMETESVAGSTSSARGEGSDKVNQRRLSVHIEPGPKAWLYRTHDVT